MMNAEKISITESRLVPFLVVCITISILTIIPFKIAGYGYLPPDDALRHVGKAVSGRPWGDILVIRDDIRMDSHPGWHAILSSLYRHAGLTRDGLVVFSIILLFILFSVIPVFLFRYPESWSLSLLVTLLACNAFLFRLVLGRPYIFTMAALLIICRYWPLLSDKRTRLAAVSLFTILIAACTWIHCGWYLFLLPVACFFLAGRIREGALLIACFAGGVLMGSAVTGHPMIFLKQTLFHAISAFSNHPLQRMLVGEFRPYAGNFLIITVVLGMLAWRYFRGDRNNRIAHDPVFLLAVSGWILGFVSVRFWLDWGIPAILIWLAGEFDSYFKKGVPLFSSGRLLYASLIAVTLFLFTTCDVGGRWTNNLTKEYLSLDNPEHKEWLPDDGGILYADDMRIFYDTFYINPNAGWKYILGFEPTMMPPDDLKTYRAIQWNYGDSRTYEPWVKKMNSKDRLILVGVESSKPNIGELEWNYTASGIWIGRLPEEKTN